MQIHKLLKIGTNHKNFCEDFLLEKMIDERYILLGVFDGCSSGVDSHLASSLIAKIIRNEADNLNNIENISETLRKIISQTALKLRVAKEIYGLQTSELLATIILFLYDIEKKAGEIIVIGDGFVSIDGEQTIIDQNNAPRYLAYEIDKFEDSNYFDLWFNIEVKFFEIYEFQDITISTDGIQSFVPIYPDMELDSENFDVINYLANDDFLITNSAMLGRKCNVLKHKYGLINYDDLGIIRIINK